MEAPYADCLCVLELSFGLQMGLAAAKMKALSGQVPRTTGATHTATKRQSTARCRTGISIDPLPVNI
jgi:hypothetical protein